MSHFKSGLCIVAFIFIPVVYAVNVLKNMTLRDAPLLPYGGSDWITHYDATHRKIWMLSGLDPGVAMLKHVMTYNLDSNDWSTYTDLSVAINGRGQYYTGAGDTIYFVGYNYDFGEFNVATQALLYDPHPTISLLIPVYAPCLVNDGRFVYIIGGAEQNSYETHYAHLQIYDLLSQQWLSDTPSLQIARSRSACHLKDGRIHVFGGFIGIGNPSSYDYTNTIETLYVGSGDSVPTVISTQTWSILSTATLSTERSGSIAVSCDSMDRTIVYIVGSREEETQASEDTIDIFNISDQTMMPSNVALNRVRTDPSVVCIDHLLYVFGGANVTEADVGAGWEDWEVSNALGVHPTAAPTFMPSSTPIATDHPSVIPSSSPSDHPSVTPSDDPSVAPSEYPSVAPSDYPSQDPSGTPSYGPSKTPTGEPSAVPTHVVLLSIEERTYTVSIKINEDDVLRSEKADTIAREILTIDQIHSVQIMTVTDEMLVVSVVTSTELETHQIDTHITDALLIAYPHIVVEVQADFEAEVKDEIIDDMEHQTGTGNSDANTHKKNPLPTSVIVVIMIVLGIICIICVVGIVCFVCKKKKQQEVESMINVVSNVSNNSDKPHIDDGETNHKQIHSASLKDADTVDNCKDEAGSDDDVSDGITLEGVEDIKRAEGTQENVTKSDTEEEYEDMYVVPGEVATETNTETGGHMSAQGDTAGAMDV